WRRGRGSPPPGRAPAVRGDDRGARRPGPGRRGRSMTLTAPRIVVTVTALPAATASGVPPRHQPYLDAIRRHGGIPVAIHAATPPADVQPAREMMDGRLLSGGVDIAPGRYGQANSGSREIQRDRDELEDRA